MPDDHPNRFHEPTSCLGDDARANRDLLGNLSVGAANGNR